MKKLSFALLEKEFANSMIISEKGLDAILGGDYSETAFNGTISMSGINVDNSLGTLPIDKIKNQLAAGNYGLTGPDIDRYAAKIARGESVTLTSNWTTVDGTPVTKSDTYGDYKVDYNPYNHALYTVNFSEKSVNTYHTGNSTTPAPPMTTPDPLFPWLSTTTFL